MGTWSFECQSFLKVRELIDKEIIAQEPYTEFVEHYREILTALENCCDELMLKAKAQKTFYGTFRDMKEEIHNAQDELDAAENCEEGEDLVNSLLREMYDLCDSANVWLAM